MNHLRNGVRFAIVVMWLVIVGVVYSLITGCNNCWALGWFGLLIYAAVGIVILYAAVVATINLWSLK